MAEQESEGASPPKTGFPKKGFVRAALLLGGFFTVYGPRGLPQPIRTDDYGYMWGVFIGFAVFGVVLAFLGALSIWAGRVFWKNARKKAPST